MGKANTEKKQSGYRENAMTEPKCVVCGEHLANNGYVYKGKVVCRGCVDFLRSKF